MSERKHILAVVLLASLWLSLLGLETFLAAPAGPAVQDDLERELTLRGARLVRYGGDLDPAERTMLLDRLELTPAERDFLEGRPVALDQLAEGWFREAAEGRLDEATQRQQADRDLEMLLFGCLWLGATLVGGPLVYLWWLLKGRKLRAEPASSPSPLAAWLLFLSWQLGAMVLVPLIVGLLGRNPPSRELVVGAQLLCYGLGLAFVIPAVGSFRPSPRGLLQGLAAFWAASLGVIVVGQIVQLVTRQPLVSRNSALDLFRNTDPEQLVWLGILVVLAGPFFEEYLFRGLLFGGLRRQGELVATLASAGLFAVAHRDPAGFLPYTVLGIVFARTYAMTGSLFPGMVAHALFNGQTFALLCLLSAG